MDLITAKVDAAKQSLKQRKKVFVNLMPDGEVEVSTKMGDDALHAYLGGSEVTIDEQPVTEVVKSKKQKTNKTTSKMETKKNGKVKQTVPKKVTAPAKVVTAKKVAAPTKAVTPVKDVGVIVNGDGQMKVKDVRAKIAKGFYAYRGTQALNPSYMANFADENKLITVTSFKAKPK